MSLLINCQDLSKDFGSKPLFHSISLTIASRDRLGIIGANGAGKSTLLKILAGELQPTTGEVNAKKFLKFHYLAQTDEFFEAATVSEAVAQGYPKARPESERFAAVNKILSQMGFVNPDLEIAQLSGGWKKRLAIGRALVFDLDLLLLDEPTNHLDIEGVIWLAKLLKNARFAWAAISHDRYFLESTTNKVAEISPLYACGLLSHKGNYSDFLLKREEYRMTQQAYAETLANKSRREAEWLKRGAKARTTKSKSRIDSAQVLFSELAELKDRLQTSSSQFNFSSGGSKTKNLVSASKITLTRDGKQLFKDMDLLLLNGLRLGVLGKNGAGKSSLLKLLVKELSPDSGQVMHRQGLKWAYFDQARQSLDQTKTLKESLTPKGDSVVYRGKSVHVISYGKKFQFNKEQMDVPLKELSGGEQARVLIARLMLIEADVLLLDEPTNDLDIPALDVLEESLLEFPGAVVLVSHDRYLMERVCNGFLGLDGQGDCALVADVSQWLDHLKKKDKKSGASVSPAKLSPSTSGKTKKLGYLEQREFDSLDGKILEAETRLASAKAKLHDPAISASSHKLAAASADHDKIQEEIELLYSRWAELEDKQREH